MKKAKIKTILVSANTFLIQGALSPGVEKMAAVLRTDTKVNRMSALHLAVTYSPYVFVTFIDIHTVLDINIRQKDGQKNFHFTLVQTFETSSPVPETLGEGGPNINRGMLQKSF
jgi:hypothetical protein